MKTLTENQVVTISGGHPLIAFATGFGLGNEGYNGLKSIGSATVAGALGGIIKPFFLPEESQAPIVGIVVGVTFASFAAAASGYMLSKYININKKQEIVVSAPVLTTVL